MNQADIEKIIEAQGFAPYINKRVYRPGDGTETTYLQAIAIEGHGRRRKRHAIGSVSKLTQMSEADLVSLIKTKTKSAQGTAKKGK